MSEPGVLVLDSDAGPELALVAEGGRARALLWPGVGARLRSMHRIELDGGGRTVELAHPSDAVYYVAAGAGSVFEPGGEREALRAGSMFHVDAGTAYVVEAGDAGLELLGGPAPADPALYAGSGEGAG